MADTLNTTRPDDGSPYSRTTPMLAVGLLALLFVLLLKLLGG